MTIPVIAPSRCAGPSSGTKQANRPAGHTETMRIGRGVGGLHPGLVTGEVVHQDQSGPGKLEEAGGTIQHTVGRFTSTAP